MFRNALRGMRSHRLHFAMSALAVVLSVAFVTGSLLYSGSVRATLASGQAGALQDVSVEIRPEPGSADPADPAAGLDESLARRLRAVSGAAAVRGTARGESYLVGRDGTLVGDLDQAVGVNYVSGQGGRDRHYPLVAGRGPRDRAEIALDRDSARRAGYRVGDRVRIVVDGTARYARLVGVVTADDSALAAGGTLTLFDTATAERQFTASAGHCTTITLTAAHGTPDTVLAARAQRVLPSGLRAVARSAPDFESATDDGGKLASLLLMFAAVAVFVAGFLIANTFVMLGAVRAREHALLRAIGATRRYVTRLVLTEALLVALIASTAGYLLGIGVAAGLNALFATGGEVAVPVRPFAVTPLCAAFGVGVVLTLLSAYLPARSAASVPPMAALRTGDAVTPASLRRRHAVGAAVTALGSLLLWAAVHAQDLLYAAVPVLLVGLIILTPLLVLGATRVARPTLGRLAGVRGTLAVENARRNPRRTAATATALMVGLALVAAITVGVASLSRLAGQQAAAGLTCDLRITAVDFGPVGAATADRVARLADASAVTAIADASVDLSGGGFLDTTAVDPATVARVLPVGLTGGSLSRMDRGVAVSDRTAAAYGWRLGSRVTGTFAQGRARVDLPVVAIYRSSDAVPSALVSLGTLPRSAAGPVDSVLVDAAPRRTAVLRREIQRALDNPALLVQSRSDVVRQAVSGYTPFLNIMYAMLSVAVLIGAIGVINTMGMAVFERVREFGLLRAIGMDRKELASLLRWEALVISLIGSALGLVAGAVIGVAAVRSEAGAPVVLPCGRLALFGAATALIGVLSCGWPGRQASRVPMLRALGSAPE